MIETDKYGPLAAEEQPSPAAGKEDTGRGYGRPEADTAEDSLIFGKFRTMEEAAENYKQAAGRVAELEKRLQRYQEEAEKYEQDIIARDNGFKDRLSMALDFDVRQHELENYFKASLHVLPPLQRAEAVRLIEKCRLKGTESDMAALRRLFSPEIVSLAAEDLALYKNAREREYEELREQEKGLRYSRKLEDFNQKYGQWADSPAKSGLLTQALEATDGRVSLPALKELIDNIEEDAVKRFQKKQTAVLENEEIQNSLQGPDNGPAKAKKKKWLTREEYYRLTPSQEKEKYDLIVEQVLLEKEGLLPRMLT